MATLRIRSDERTIRFDLDTTGTVTSAFGTTFVPNAGQLMLQGQEVLSVRLDCVDKDGFEVDDPAGPEGAVLAVYFAHGELATEGRAKLPDVVQYAMATALADAS